MILYPGNHFSLVETSSHSREDGLLIEKKSFNRREGFQTSGVETLDYTHACRRSIYRTQATRSILCQICLSQSSNVCGL